MRTYSSLLRAWHHLIVNIAGIGVCPLLIPLQIVVNTDDDCDITATTIGAQILLYVLSSLSSSSELCFKL